VRKVLQLNLIVHKTKQNLMTQNQIKKEERQVFHNQKLINKSDFEFLS